MEIPRAKLPSMHGTYGHNTRPTFEYSTQRYDNPHSNTLNFSQRVYHNPQPSSQSFKLIQLPTPTSSSGACLQSPFFQDLEPLQETHGSQNTLPSPEATPAKANLTDSASGFRTQDVMTFDDEPYHAQANNFYNTSPTKWLPKIHTSYRNDSVPISSVWRHDYSQDVQIQGLAPQSQDVFFPGYMEPSHNQYEHPDSRKPTGECKYHAISVRTPHGDTTVSTGLSECQNLIMRPSFSPDCRRIDYLTPTPAVVETKFAPPSLSQRESPSKLETGTALAEPQSPYNLSRNRRQSTLNMDSSISKRRKTRNLSPAGKAHATAVRKSKGGACKLCRKRKIKCLHKLAEDRALHTLTTFDPNLLKTETGARPFDPMLYSPTQDLA